MKKYILIALFLFTGLNVVPAFASKYGCQVLLCLSNPGGATQFNECKPPIKKLLKDLAKGGSFPSCDFGSSEETENVKVEDGYEKFFPCNSGYTATTKFDTDVGKNGRNVPICRKHIGFKTVISDDNKGSGGSRQVPIFSDIPKVPRSQPYWVHVRVDGIVTGQRFWFSKG